MTVYELLKKKNEKDLAIILTDMAAKIAKQIIMEEYEEELEINNFMLCDIEQEIFTWLNKELKKK
jgi:hypothetical protein